MSLLIMEVLSIFSAYKMATTGVIVLKEMKLVLPNSQRINRGNYRKNALTEACIDQKITDLILLKEHRGTPGWYQEVFEL